MKSLSLILLMIMLAARPAPAAADSSFTLSAGAADFDSYFPSYLANGYFSTMTAPRGTEGNLAYMVAFMDYGKDDISRPAAIPGWSEIDYSAGDSAAGQFWMNQVPLNPLVFKDYSQVLNMRDATLTTGYRYVDHGRSTQIKVVTFVSEASTHLAATQISLTPEFDGTVELSFALNLWAPYQPRLPLARLTGEEMQEAVAAHNMKLAAIPPATPDRAAVWYHGDTHVLAADGETKDLTLWLDGRAEQGLAMAEAAALGLPDGMRPADVVLYKSPYRLALNLSVRVQRNKTYTFTKFIAASREGWGGDAKADLELARQARSAGFEALIGKHRAAWLELWRSDIAIDGDARAQTAVHSDLYYLLATSTADTRWPMGACGLTPGYTGHAFWDSDSWIFPALLLLHPERAKSLVMFRAHTLPAAQERAQARGFNGAKYPWEADPENGSEQTPHFAYVLGEREIHVNADIAIAQWQYWLATHDRDWLKKYGWPVIRNLADFWSSRSSWNPDKKRYEIVHVTSVAESYNDVPNDTFTNASAQKVLMVAAAAAALLGERADPHWAEVAAKLYIPFSDAEQRHLDFDANTPRAPLEGSTLDLLMYPSLDFPMSKQVRRNDFDYTMISVKEGHHQPHGMSLAPASIAAAAVGDTPLAVTWLQNNFTSGLIKPPFNVRTETANNNSGYFVTASGGFLQNLLYGFSGLRVEEMGLVGAYAPVLPPQWKSMTLKGISFRGQRYDFTVARDASGRVELTRKDTPSQEPAGSQIPAVDAAAAPKPEDTEQWEPVPSQVLPGVTDGAAPSDAIILFDGRNLDEWVMTNGRSQASWRVENGAMIVDKAFGNIETKRLFKNYQLHLEWRIPSDITGTGQARGNSGLFLASTALNDGGYEVQILDCWENRTYVNGQAASIYKQSPPLVNACRKPGQWQSYDVVWNAPEFQSDGTLLAPGTVTVFHNGVLVQNHFRLSGETVYIGKPAYRPYDRAAIKLQSHHDPSAPISFRNIWVRELP